MTTAPPHSIAAQAVSRRPVMVFGLLWVILFALYYPAAQAGRVGDFPGWVKNVSTMPFWDYVNRTESHIPSLYQFTQMVTWLFYQLFGVNAWAWHLLYISMQALNACLLYLLCAGIFADTGVKGGDTIAICGTLLFCICPHISEVVVWEPSFHYLLGFLFMLLVLHCTRRFLHTGQSKYAWQGGVLFFLSTWSLEVFYLTPALSLALCVFYRSSPGQVKQYFGKSLVQIVLPQVVFFALHLVLVNMVYHSGIGHIGTNTMKLSVETFSKPLKYIFHILFLGRFFTDGTRGKVYHICENTFVLAMFYTVVASFFVVIAMRAKQLAPRAKVIALLLFWTVCAIGLISLIWFPNSFVVIYDRYTYVADAFIFMLLCVLLSYVPSRPVMLGTLGLYALANLYFTYKVNKLWKVSGNMVNELVKTFPNDPKKTVLILNVPECYYGVQMIGSREEGEFGIMYNALMPQKLTNQVYEVSAFNITSPNDGAHVMVINDTLVHVTLNQWATWWWWFGFGAGDYENEYYRLKMTDVGHWYELFLKKPSGEYLLLYTVGDKWRTVDMSKKNIDQN